MHRLTSALSPWLGIKLRRCELRVLVVGNGAREHALVSKLKESPSVSEVFCTPGNAGIAQLATCLPIDTSNIVELADLAEKLNIDLTVVGPELPLSLGIVDGFKHRDLVVFGSTQAATEIEASKVYAKNLMKEHNIPTGKFHVCSTPAEAEAIIKQAPFGFPVVVKADGLAAGKGVIVAADEAEALRALDDIMRQRAFGNAGDQVVIEEFLEGEEVSFLVVTDGEHVVPLATARDYKRALENDGGLNTGGMGALSPARSIDADTSKLALRSIVYPTLKALREDGRLYSGVLYVGLILTSDGPKVLEFNARFGDPEAQSILPRFTGDLAELMMAAVNGKLADTRPIWRKEVAVSVVLASGGYPGKYETGQVITGIEDAAAIEGVEVFHAATMEKDGQLVTCGGRVLTVTARAPSLSAARELAYKGVSKIKFENMTYRRDIGAVSSKTD